MAQRPPETAPGPHTIDPLAKAVQEFNSWRFYDCHETLEGVWREVGGKSSQAEMADFYQGIIKVAAGFHHLLRNNHKGAVLLLADSLRLLSPYGSGTLGVDVESLMDRVRECLDRIKALGPQHLREFDRQTIPTIRLEDAVSD